MKSRSTVQGRLHWLWFPFLQVLASLEKKELYFSVSKQHLILWLQWMHFLASVEFLQLQQQSEPLWSSFEVLEEKEKALDPSLERI